MNDTITRPTSTKPMTRGAGSQFEFISNLLDQIGAMAPGRRDALRNEMNSQYRQRSFTTRDASTWIDRLKGIRNEIRASVQAAEAQLRTGVPAPRAAEPRPEVPSGRYAVENEEGKLAFYRVERDDNGRYRMFVYASDRQHRISGSKAMLTILRKIVTAGIEPAGMRFADEREECRDCGRGLTDQESRSRGRGPICAGLRSK